MVAVRLVHALHLQVSSAPLPAVVVVVVVVLPLSADMAG